MSFLSNLNVLSIVYFDFLRKLDVFTRDDMQTHGRGEEHTEGQYSGGE
jgi:hypothetical protein